MAFLMLAVPLAVLLWGVWLAGRYKGRAMGPEPEPETLELRVRFEENQE